MSYRREIKYDYKIRLDWGKPARRKARGAQWALAAAAPIAVALLGGMASHEISTHEFRLPPWGALFEQETPSPARVLRIPVSSESPFLPAETEPGPAPAEATATPAPEYTPAPVPIPDSTETAPDTTAESQEDGADWQTVTIKSGDNLSLIFGRLGLSGGDLDRILGLGGDTAGLKHLSPDQNLRFRIKDGTLEEMVHEIDPAHTLHVRNQDGAFTAETVVEKLDTREVHITGEIRSSLFEAGQDAGLSDAMIMKLAEVFGYDIDFVLDLREGDHFTVVYEGLYRDNEKVKDGNILAAEFVNNGNTYRAVRYEDPEGHTDYYAPDGHSLRKAFIRTPVEFTRITSYFSLARKHPILNTIRAHKGVDYAAPIGTPVKAAGDARVSYAGWQGGYGKVIMLQHTGNYTTVYGHLSAYAKGVRTGTSVRQGQTIGYVGMTGLATGPHLHYEFRINGVHRDPLKVALPKALPIGKEHIADFREKTREALAQLDAATRTASAATDNPGTSASAGPATVPPDKVAEVKQP